MNKSLKKKIKKQLDMFALIISAGTMGAFMFVLIIGSVYTIHFHNNMYIQELATAPLHEIAAKEYQKNNLILNISNVCKDNDEKNEAKCVSSFIINNYRYNITDSIGKLRSPELIMQNGGYCQEWALMYAALLKNLGWETTFRYEPKHIYTTGCKNGFCCNFDQEKVNCH